MAVLAIDTALDRCHAAVLEGGAVRGISGASARGDAEAILDHVDAALAAAALDVARLERVAVTVGPGSFTGVRVGIACAKGLAHARGIPAVGIPTLSVIARQVGEPVLAVVDARHGAVFAGAFPDPFGPPSVMGRMAAGACAELAAAHGLVIAGAPSALTATGPGIAVESLDLAALSRAADGDPEGREPRALYLAEVDAAPQGHKALARA